MGMVEATRRSEMTEEKEVGMCTRFLLAMKRDEET